MSLKTRLLTSTLIATLSLAAGAGDACAVIWKTLGAEVKPGVNNFKVEIKKPAGAPNFVIKTAVVEVSCTEQTSANSEIEGGKPGKAGGSYRPAKCTVVKPEKCQVQDANLKEPGKMVLGFSSELVEDVKGLKLYNNVVLASEIDFINKGLEECPIAAGSPYVLLGDVVSEIKPEKTEETVIKLGYPATPIKEYLSGGVFHKAELKLEAEKATLSGESMIEEEPKPAKRFGAF